MHRVMDLNNFPCLEDKKIEYCFETEKALSNQ